MCISGDLRWEKLAAPLGQHWLIVEGLQSGVHYEMRVVARNTEEAGSPETSSPIQTVVIGLKRGKCHHRGVCTCSGLKT